MIDPDESPGHAARGDAHSRRRVVIAVALLVAVIVVALATWVLAASSDTDSDGAPAVGVVPPAETRPTEPPTTELPATDPPATQPPTTEPPTTDPPTTEPIVTEAPATGPPLVDDPTGLPFQPGLPAPPSGPTGSLVDDRGHRAIIEPLETEIRTGESVTLRLEYREWGKNGFFRDGRSVEDAVAWCLGTLAEGQGFRPSDFERGLPIAFEVLDGSDPAAFELPGPDGVPFVEPITLLPGNPGGLARLDRSRLAACGDGPLDRDPENYVDAWWDGRFAPMDVVIDTTELPAGTYVLVPAFDFRSPTWLSGTLATLVIRD